jgi:hypothetical protein
MTTISKTSLSLSPSGGKGAWSTLSKILSYLFHPLLVPTYVLLVMIRLNPYLFYGLAAAKAISIVAYSTFFFPAVAILLMKKLGFISSLEMPDKQQRIIPLIVVIVCFVWNYLSVKQTGFPQPFTWFILGAVISLFLAFFINVFQKLSLHTVALSGALMAIMMMFFYAQLAANAYFLLIILILGAVASARLYLKAHTPREINTGFIVGILGQALAAFFM